MPSTQALMISTLKDLLNRSGDLKSDIAELKEDFRKKIILEGKLLKSEGETEDNMKLTFERVMTYELSQYVNMSESPTLNRLKKTVDSISPSVAHYKISALVGSKYKPILLTTNYDDLIERSLKTRSITVYGDDDFENAKTHVAEYLKSESSTVPVFKFHGSIEDFGSIKASVEHTLSLEPNKAIFLTRLLNGDLLKETIPDYDNTKSTIRVIFIGYSFNDPDVNSVLRSIQYSPIRPHIYTVNPNQSTNQILRDFARDDYMKSRISLPFSIFSNQMSLKLTANSTHHQLSRQNSGGVAR